MLRHICLFALSGLIAITKTQAQAVLPADTPVVVGAYPLTISGRFTTNLIFPYGIAQADLGSGDLVARKWGRMENVLLLKAGRPGFSPTNLSVYTADGRLYSFLVGYVDSPGVVNYLFPKNSWGIGAPSSWALFSGKPNEAILEQDAAMVERAQRFLKIRGRDGKVSLRLTGAYIRDGLLWLPFAAANGSLISFDPGFLQFTIRDRKRVKRTAVQELGVAPVYVHGDGVLPGGNRSRLSVALRPFTVDKYKILVVEWVEKDSGRRVLVKVKGAALLRARKLG